MYYASHDITVAYTFNYICLWKAVKRGLDIILMFVIPIRFFILARMTYFQPK